MNSFLSSAEQFWLGGAKLENLKQLFNQTGSVCILTFLPHFLD